MLAQLTREVMDQSTGKHIMALLKENWILEKNTIIVFTSR